MDRTGLDALADAVREASAAVAIEVTEAFLDRHPSWRAKYGARAITAGVQDASYHLAFLSGAIEAGDPTAFATYARWAARVLAARGIASSFLSENLEQLRDALQRRLARPGDAIVPYFDAAIASLSVEPEFPEQQPPGMTTDVFVQAILTGQRTAAVQIAREALRDGMSLQDLYVHVLQAALYEVGARWEANQLTVAQEHVATAVTQYVMAQIYEPPRERPRPRGSVVMTGVEGEFHNVGAVMVGDLLELAGWNVRFLGTNLPPASILGAVREARASHLGISATMLFNVHAVRQLIADIRSEFGPSMRIVVGGAAFRTIPQLWRHVAADAFAPDLAGVHHAFEGTS